ncbi:MAG: M50 family metallopeptidase [Calditrichaceae bacterium]
MESFAGMTILYLIRVSTVTLSQIFILLGPVLILSLIMYYISDVLEKKSLSVFGYNFLIYFTAIGVAVHELGHAVFALIFGHKLAEVKLFSPDKESGTLGYVHHTYNNRNWYHRIGNFFIGIGPILFGSIIIYFSAKFLVGNHLFLPLSDLSINTSTLSSTDNAWTFIREVYFNVLQVFAVLIDPKNLSDWKFYVFLYLVFAIGSNIKLSPPDIKGAWTGFSTLVVLMFVFNLITLWIGDQATAYVILISQTYSFFYAIMIFTAILSIVFIMFITIIKIIKGAIVR